MVWKKSSVKAPFLIELTKSTSTLKHNSDILTSSLGLALTGIKTARSVFSATPDPFIALFSELLTQLENLVKETFDAGIYSLVVDPRTSAGSRVTKINLTLPTSLDSSTLLTPEQIADREAKLTKDGKDPVLTYDAMRSKVSFKRSNWKYDNFGIPLMTPNQCLQSMLSSLDDINDPNRPIFSDTSQLAAVGFIVSAPDLDSFLVLAQSLLNVLDIEPLLNLISNFKTKTKKETEIPKGGQLPDWTNQAKVSDIKFMKDQRDALLSALAQVQAVVGTSSDKSIDRLLSIIEQKIKALDDVVKEFGNLIANLPTLLDAKGIYTLRVDTNDNGGFGGVNYLKSQLKSFDTTASTLTKDSTGYTFGFLMLGAGPSLAAVRSLTKLLLDIKALKIIGGANAKQKITFSAPPAEGSTIDLGDGLIFVPHIDPTTFIFTDPNDIIRYRQNLQASINNTGGHKDALVALSTTTKLEESTTSVEGVNNIPSILSGEKTGLGFVVEFQGQDSRKPQPLLDFSDPGVDTIYELCFNEVPISGSFVLSINGVLTTSIPFTTTSNELAEILNNTQGVFNKVSVIGSFASCFTITFSKINVVVLVSSSSLIGVSGPIIITSSITQVGKNPANSLFDKDGRPIVITVETIVEGRRNDLCEA